MNLTADGKAVSIQKLLPVKTASAGWLGRWRSGSTMFLIMRLAAIILLTASLHVSAAGLSQTVTMTQRNARLEDVFDILQKQTNYNFIFNSHMLARAKKVNIRVSNATVEQVLFLCFSGQPFTYVIHDKTIVVKEKVVTVEKPAPSEVGAPIPPQQVTGTVRDDNNNPVEGAAVTVKTLGTGTATDKMGKFVLNLPAGKYELEISFVGYKTEVRTITVGEDHFTNLNIILHIASTGLNEIVVVGYGTQRKRDVTGSISSVKGEDIQNLPVGNVASTLQGRAAGVDIVRNDGSPGSVPDIRIRGTGTINDASPLVVIDGVPSAAINDVNPNDIASIEILKDASASAIYGSRAANGVLLITTRKGNFGDAAKLSASAYTGWNKAAKYLDMLKAPDLVALKKEAYTNDGLSVPGVWNNSYYSTDRTDWQRALIKTGVVQNADVAVRGGNASSSYSFSGNYYNERGMIVNSFFKRYSFRINSEHKIGSRFRIGENVVYSRTSGSSPDTKSTQTGLVWSAIRFNPAIPVANPDGSWGTSQADNQLGDINNPVATANEVQKINKFDRILGNAFAELEILKGLKLRANYGIDYSTEEDYEFDNAMPNQTRGPSIASLQQKLSKGTTFLEEYFITYNHIFNKVHNLTLTGGYSAQEYGGNYFKASRNGFADTSLDQRVLNLGNSSSAANEGYNYNPSGLQSYFARANYAYAGKYLLTATMRADGSSKFAPGKRWGYFPAFSAGWRVSDEKFYGSLKDKINTLKLTGGWGQLGNQNVGDFQYLSVIGYGGGGGTGGGGYSYNLGTGTVNYNGAYVTSLANPNITWERAVMTNISAELGFLNNHLNATITYFNKNTSDMLVPFQLVETYGAQRNLPDDPGNITLPDYNLGKLNNHGIEIELTYGNTVGKLGYSLGANASFLRNKVTRLYGNSTYIASTPYGRENTDISRTYEGQPIASFYGFRTAGLYQSQADIDNDPNVANDPNKGNIKPGDVKFLDVNGSGGKKDGIINDQDRVNLGDPNPRFVFGFHGTLTYKGFDLNFNFVGATGFKLYNADRLSGLDATQVYNWYADQKGRWHGANTSNTIPRLSIANLNNNYRSSDLWVQNGSYLSLKSLSLGYTISKQHVGDWQLPDVRVYFSSYNLFMLTGYKGYTPELGYTNGNLQRGVDVAQYPSARNLTIGASVNF